MRMVNFHLHDNEFTTLLNLSKEFKLSRAELMRQGLNLLFNNQDKIDKTKTCINLTKDWQITPEMHDVLEGLIFSDANIEKTGRYPRFYFSQCGRHDGYVEFIAEKLNIGDRIKRRKRFDKRTNKIYEVCEFKTFSVPELLPYHHRWYPDGKIKIIPESFVLTPVSLVHAFMSDGCYRYRSREGYKLELCTMAFSKENLESTVLPQLSNLNMNPKISKNNEICLYDKKSVYNFFDYIGPCPVECFKYKWPESTVVV